MMRPFRWRAGTFGPPLLLLHGTGGDEHDLLALGERLSPDSPLLSPRGTVMEGPHPRFFRRLAEGVFDEVDLTAQVDALADFVQKCETEYGVEPGSWVAVGFSTGANIASAMMFQRPEILSGAVLLAAMVPFATPPAGDLNGKFAVVANGRWDPMATAAQTATLVSQLRHAGAEVTLLQHDGGHTVDTGQLAAIAELIASRHR